MEGTIRAGTVYTEQGQVNNGEVVIESGVISGIRKAGKRSPEIDLPGLALTPGFIDIHTHGAGPFSVEDAAADVAREKLKEGVTAFCPTIKTATMAKISRVLYAVDQVGGEGGGARILGAFLEGPWIGPGYPGRHPAALARAPVIERISEITRTRRVASALIAPELNGAAEAARWLAESGVNVRFGHTGATYAQTKALIDAGANCCVHLFNAMAPITAREAGAAGAALLHDCVFAEIIADKRHLCGEAIMIARKMKPGRLILVTDSAGEEKGGFNAEVARAGGGSVPVSRLKMNEAVRNAAALGISAAEAIEMAAKNPALCLGIYDTSGSIAVGKRADIAALDGYFNVAMTVVGGEPLYKRWERK
jgi:N-acetylglucosamine-6-phosphate deacetylase